MLTVRPTISGAHVNQAVVSADQADPIAANNTAVTTVTAVLVVEPSLLVVTNTLNGGAGSLRQAILDANAHAGPDTITFAIPGAGLHQILPLAAGLPAITDPVTIDATTQPGFAVGAPIVELNGSETTAGTNGLVINAGSSVVRGLIINRFSGSGIVLQGGDSNAVVGNWIGTMANGAAPAGNGNGVLILSSGNSIGGATLAERNVISGNTNGVQIGQPALGNAVLGNLIGTDYTGTLDVGNTEAGVLVIGEANAIGGSAAGSRNLISGNIQAGVQLAGGASANTVQGNLIGTDISGANPLANGIGVIVGANVDSTASTNTIGGFVAGTANVIAFNATIGVTVGQSSSDNAILGNSIHDNGALGIDLIGNGVTPNDVGDTDEGANNLTNFPVLAAAAGGVQGTLNSFPDATFRIEFFGNAACDASGNGEGATFLGATTVSTDGTGNAIIPVFTAPAGQFVTATATDSSNNTSEFSTCVQTGEQPEISIAATDPDAAELGPDTATIVVTRSGPTTLDRDVLIAVSGTAANISDYAITSPALLGSVNSSSFSVRIPAGQTSATITISPIFIASTAEVEGPETAIFSAEGNDVTVTIADEPAVTVTATDADAAELGSNTATVVVARAGPATYDRDVFIALSGTATNTSDYTITSPALLGSVNFNSFSVRIPAGQTSATVTIMPTFVASTAEVEGPETAIFSAEGAVATVTIADEPAVTLTATDAAAAELGPNTGTVVVTRTGATTYDRDVFIALSGTALNTSDYTITSPALLGSVNFNSFSIRIPAGQTSATVTVTPIFIASTAEVEGPETAIFASEGAVATVTIADEPAVTLTATDAAAAELGPNTATVVVARAGATTYDRDVFIAISGTATNVSDYAITSPALLGSVNFNSFSCPHPGGPGERHRHHQSDLHRLYRGGRGSRNGHPDSRRRVGNCDDWRRAGRHHDRHRP